MSAKKASVLAIIPARAGSKRIPNKNIRSFAGKSLLTHTIAQARALSFVDRIIVDTDSPEIARIATRGGAEVLFLRPKHLARDTSQVVDSVLYLLHHIKKTEGYQPRYILLLQTTSPLREVADIEACWKLMKKSGATTVLTVAPTHPQLYHLDKHQNLSLANREKSSSSNTQAWEKGYLLNGCFAYLVDVQALLKEKKIITRKTRAVVCPKWRSVDLDTPEEWVLAETICRNKKSIESALKRFK